MQLREGVIPEAFETFIEDQIPNLKQHNQLLEETRFSLLHSIAASNEYLLHVAFPENELERVTRAAWPFVIRATLELLRDVRNQHADLTSVVSGTEQTPEQLVEEWNLQFGRFSKMSL
jgi:hypothetical protein